MRTKTLLLVCFLSLNIFAISGYSPYKVYQQTDTLTHANLDSNIIRGSSWSTKMVDTLDKQFIRFSDVDDSSFTQIDVDTIDADTITSRKVKITTLTTSTAAADSATIPIFKGAKTIRDTTTFIGGAYFAGIARFAGTLYAPVVDIDSIIGALKISGILSLYPNAGNYNGQLTFSGWAPNANVDDNYIGYNCVSNGSGYPSKITSTRSGWFIGQRTVNAAGTNGSASLNINFWPVDTTAYFTHITFVGAKKASDASTVINTPATVNGALTTTTINTGNGDCELYPMNQDVRSTASPTFAGVTISGNSDWYKDTTFYDSLYDATTYVTNSTARIVKIGRVVTLYQPEMVGTLSGGSTVIKGIPTSLKPSETTYSPCAVKVGAVSYPGVLTFTSGAFYLQYDNGTAYGWIAGGSDRGFHSCTITWVIN